jgi:hypothetical protein
MRGVGFLLQATAVPSLFALRHRFSRLTQSALLCMLALPYFLLPVVLALSPAPALPTDLSAACSVLLSMGTVYNTTETLADTAAATAVDGGAGVAIACRTALFLLNTNTRVWSSISYPLGECYMSWTLPLLWIPRQQDLLVVCNYGADISVIRMHVPTRNTTGPAWIGTLPSGCYAKQVIAMQFHDSILLASNCGIFESMHGGLLQQRLARQDIQSDINDFSLNSDETIAYVAGNPISYSYSTVDWSQHEQWGMYVRNVFSGIQLHQVRHMPADGLLAFTLDGDVTLASNGSVVTLLNLYNDPNIGSDTHSLYMQHLVQSCSQVALVCWHCSCNPAVGRPY